MHKTVTVMVHVCSDRPTDIVTTTAVLSACVKLANLFVITPGYTGLSKVIFCESLKEDSYRPVDITVTKQTASKTLAQEQEFIH